MNRFFLSAAAGAAVVACSAPEAAAQVYGGVGLAFLNSDLPSGRETSYTGYVGRAGFKFNPFVSLEGEIYAHATYGTDFFYSNPSLPGQAYHVGLEDEYGAFAVGWLPIPAVGDLFARVGVVQTSISTSMAGPEDSSGYAFGAGAQTGFMMARLRGEYTRYEVDNATVEGFAASVLLQF